MRLIRSSFLALGLAAVTAAGCAPPGAVEPTGTQGPALSPAPEPASRVTLTAVASLDEQPLAGGKVTLYDAETRLPVVAGRVIGETVTDVQGRFSLGLAGARPGEVYLVSVAAPEKPMLLTMALVSESGPVWLGQAPASAPAYSLAQVTEGAVGPAQTTFTAALGEILKLNQTLNPQGKATFARTFFEVARQGAEALVPSASFPPALKAALMATSVEDLRGLDSPPVKQALATLSGGNADSSLYQAMVKFANETLAKFSEVLKANPNLLDTSEENAPTAVTPQQTVSVTVFGQGKVTANPSAGTLGIRTTPNGPETPILPGSTGQNYVNPSSGSRHSSSSSTVPAPTVTAMTPAQGPEAGGTSVTITGTNLTGATVTVSGNEVANPVVTATEITFDTPAGTGANQAVVVTTTGGSVTVTGGFTYEPATPSFTATGLLSGSADIAGGTDLAVQGTGLDRTTATVTVGGLNATVDRTSQSTDTLLRFIAPAHAAGPADVVVTQGGTSITLTGAVTYADLTPTVTGMTPTTGASGGTFTITGTNLGQMTGVSFDDGTMAWPVGDAMVNEAGTEITGTIPDTLGGGAATVTVEFATTSLSVSGGFTFQ